MNSTTKNLNRYVIAAIDNVPESIYCVPQCFRAYPQMNVEDADPASGNNLTTTTVAPAISTDVEQTTTFNTDGLAVTTIDLMRSYLPRMFLSSSDSNNSQDIKAFLAKPVVHFSGEFAATDTLAGSLLEMALPSDLITNQVIQDKLKGYLGIRATCCFKIVVNGNPFQAGRYMLVHVPTGGHAVFNSKGISFVEAHTNTLFERTQLKRVEIDISCDTEGIMKIPYSSVYNYYPLACLLESNGWASTGCVRLYAYSPLVDPSGTAKARFTLYTWFEDVELIGAAQPQMGTPSEMESKKAGNGPVSSVLLGFSKAASIVSVVPMLSTYASTASWALDIAGRAAKAAGFSKPMDFSAPHRMIAGAGQNLGTVDGFDSSVSVAATSNPGVSLISGFAGTDVDEMDIVHIATIPAWYKTLSWTTASTGVLQSFDLCPGLWYQTRVFSSLSVKNMTPACMISDFFHSWRGSLVFTFKFVKTSFHSGRLSFAFVPRSMDYTSTPYDALYADFLHRQIVDIRTCNEITITVPYVNHNPYLSRGQSFGQLIVSVVDGLVAPASVSSTIKILTEVSCGPDIEFARPIGRNTVDSGIQGTAFYGATPQMGESVCAITSTNIGSTSIVSSSTLNAELCVGEKITSLRSLLKIAKIQRFPSAIAAGSVTSISPFTINSVTWTSAPNLTLGYSNGDLYDLLGACYLYSRGGMCIKAYSATPKMGVVEIADGVTPSGYYSRGATDLYGQAWTSGALGGGKYALAALSGNNVFAEWYIPQYGHRHSRNNIGLMANARGGYTPVPIGELGPSLIFNWTIGIPVSGGGASADPTFRSVGEDFSFGCFISTVPTYYNSSGTNL